ncbi:MAG TPA: metalloregulator ArsR/SmtB family transcription factor [Planctomycetota bacterium]|nr:metalloregulator ArsR/SmtB family transcription factor [Planctomycetota bacterium]
MVRAKEDVGRVLHALADPTRRSIVERLARGPLSVSALAGPLGVTLTAVNQHLHVLEKCRLVRTEKTGRVRSCRIEAAGFGVLTSWVDAQRSIWEARLDRLGDILNEEEK